MMQLQNQRVVWQILLWWAAWVLVSFFLTNGIDNPTRFLNASLGSFIGICIVIGINMELLLPRLYFRRKTALFIVAGVLLIGTSAWLIYGDVLPWSEVFNQRGGRSGKRPPLPDKMRKSFNGIRWLGRSMPFIIAFLGSTLVEIARFANQKEKEAIRSEKEKLETEVKFLKSQINPHFLFNALNNIYTLAVIKAPQTPESVMQLSEILRYMVYDSNEERVKLEDEVNYIENYVNLKLLKDSKGMDVTLNLDKTAPGLLVAPLLFIPFVENAFKHSKIEDRGSGFIRIQLDVRGKLIEFSVENSLPDHHFTKDQVGGVGLDNIRKRLQLLYPGNLHHLLINQSSDRFTIHLSLNTQ